MGTRHLICVVKDGAFKIAQYGQWDGYPDGQGQVALNFLRGLVERSEIDVFATKVAGCCFFTETEIDELNKSSNPFAQYPHLSRDISAGILNVVFQSDAGLPLVDQHQFAGNGLFCEWAYVVDLDLGTFEVYRGFHHEPAPDGERFAFLNVPKEEFVPEYKGQNYYGPVHLAATFSLAALPTDDAFLAAFAEPEEEAEDAA